MMEFRTHADRMELVIHSDEKHKKTTKLNTNFKIQQWKSKSVIRLAMCERIEGQNAPKSTHKLANNMSNAQVASNDVAFVCFYNKDGNNCVHKRFGAG